MVLSSTTIFKWELTLYSHGNRLHFELLILASETSILLHNLLTVQYFSVFNL